MTFLKMYLDFRGSLSLVNSNGYQLAALTGQRDGYNASYPADGEMMLLYNLTNYGDGEDLYFTVEWECDEDTPVVPPAEGYDSSDYLTLAQNGTYERLFYDTDKCVDPKWIIPCTGILSIAEQVGNIGNAHLMYINSNGSTVFVQWPMGTSTNEYEVSGDFLIHLVPSGSVHSWNPNFFLLSWSCESVTGAPLTNSPVYSFAPTAYPLTFAPPTSAPDLPATHPPATDLPAGATFAPPPPPSVNALCTTDEDCRLGRLDPKSTCEDGTCVCHTQGYAYPPGVPLCLLADDVTVPMAFAVEYDGVEAQSLWTTATTREIFEDTMGEALGTVTDMRVVVSDGGVLVVGMVRASTAKLADALSGKEDLAAALSSEGVSVSHGVTCARTDASYTVQHNGVCNAVECEGSTTLTLTDGTYRCEREAAPQPEESGSGSGSESGVSSKVFLYVGIGVGVLGVAVGVVVAFCCLHKKQPAKELESPLNKVPLAEDAELCNVGETLN